MIEIRCFWLDELPLARLWLRRYADGPCSANPGEYSYHNVKVAYRDQAPKEKVEEERGHSYMRVAEQPPSNDDPRWPTHCVCGFEFKAEHPHQLFWHSLYRRADTREVMTIEDAPPGAMWDAWWIGEHRDYHGPGSMVGADRISLMVKTPGGEWFVDGPATNGAGWTRSGTPPDVTASPSILISGRYHGWLRNGVLVPC